MYEFPRAQTLAVAGVETFVGEAGAGAPIVLLHGNPDTHVLWGGVAERLAAFYRCIAPDMPGFGKSHAPDDFDYSLANQGAWVGALLDALALERVHLVVHDVGGPYGLTFAAEHPERIRSLTIFNTVFFSDYHWHFWARIWRTPFLGELSMRVMNHWLFRREMLRGSPRMPLDYIDYAYDKFTPAVRRHVLRWYRAMDPSVWQGWDARLAAATSSTPKQIVWGDLDPYLPAADADRFGGDVCHVADCGHWVMLENPELSATMIKKVCG